jgi:hypothetical protein
MRKGAAHESEKIFFVLLGSAIYVLAPYPSLGQSESIREAEGLELEAIWLYKQGRYADAIPPATPGG